MGTMNITSVVQSCFDSGVVLTVLDDGKLSIKGNKTAPAVTELKDLVQRDRAAVLAAIVELNAQRMIAQPNGAESSAESPLQRAADVGLNATDHPSKFLGLIVSDDDMFTLYYRAHKMGLRLTSQPQSNPQPCDHLVMSCSEWR